MDKRILFALPALAVMLPVGLAAARFASAFPRAAPPAPALRPAVPAPALFPSTGAAAVVDAANAFLATLSDKQKAIVLTAQTPQNAARWSNFPAGFVPRNGIFFRDLSAQQTTAALKVARLALSPEGFQRFQEIRATDDAFAKQDKGPGGPRRGGFGGPGGPPPSGGFNGPPPGGGFGGPPPGGPGGFGGGQNLFGAGNYIIAFLGKPSKTAPWLLQLGGHHLAFNLYYKGQSGAATPYFVGVQPNIWKDASGKTHEPLAPMHNAMYGLVHSLTPDQLTQARLNASFSDVYVGPGRDGQFPAHEGVPVTQLSAASKGLVKQAIAEWTGDSVQASDYRKRYNAEMDQTKVAYSGGTALNAEGDYVRIDGPHVWIEFACQGSDHYHTIWRDRTSDYGAEFSF